jgi:Protein of unknown function (DUF2750)
MAINVKQMQAILSLPAPKRYDHFVKRVVGWGCVWMLDDDDWVLAETDDGTSILPIWPDREYAERCISGDWDKCSAKSLPLEQFLDVLVPSMIEKGIEPGVFFSDEKGAINVQLHELVRDLRSEMKRYV